ncbi:hypothetical protein D3C84_832220 [compost metagenome]
MHSNSSPLLCSSEMVGFPLSIFNLRLVANTEGCYLFTFIIARIRGGIAESVVVWDRFMPKSLSRAHPALLARTDGDSRIHVQGLRFLLSL